MKITLNLIVAMLLAMAAGCGHIEINYTDPETGAAQIINIDGPRKTAVTIGKDGVAVIQGEVAISNETVQVLAKEAAPILTGEGN